MLLIVTVVIIALMWFLGFPIFIAFLAGDIFFIALHPGLSVANIPAMMFAKMDSWILLAIPLFILAGYLMAYGKAAKYLVQMLEGFVGWVPGGLWVCSAFSCMIFGTMTGSGPATTVAIGTVMMPSLEQKGYPRGTSAGLIAACGTLGNLIPPSIGLIIIGAIAGVSVAKLFMGGVFPGILIGLTHATLSLIMARRRRLKGVSVSWGERGRRTWSAIPALFTPVIILGGIYSGIFTPTEAAAVAIAWAFIITFIQRQLKLSTVNTALSETLKITAALYVLLGAAMVFAHILIYLQVPQALTQFVLDRELSATAFLLFSWFIWLVMGTVLDAAPVKLISIPLLWNSAMALGIDPVHYGVFMAAVVVAGQETPPYGLNLFAISGVGKVPIEEVYKGVLPFAAIEYAVLLLVLFFPALSTWLPSVMK